MNHSEASALLELEDECYALKFDIKRQQAEIQRQAAVIAELTEQLGQRDGTILALRRKLAAAERNASGRALATAEMLTGRLTR